MTEATRKKPCARRQAPLKPTPDECCQRGCDPCIFDYYERALARWQAAEAAREAD